MKVHKNKKDCSVQLQGTSTSWGIAHVSIAFLKTVVAKLERSQEVCSLQVQ